jgi:hypothetical protein
VSNEILRWVTSLGVAGVLVTLLNGLFTKRKMSADTMKVITEAASGTLKDVRDENTRLLARQITTDARLDALERENRDQAEHQRQTDALVIVHGEWDRQAFYALRIKGIELPEPPPLTIGGPPQ